MKISDTKIKAPPQSLRRKKHIEDESARPSLLNESNRQEIRYISIDRLVPYHKQARIHFDEKELENLADTIRQHGIRQPLTIVPAAKEEDKFEVISGERRLRAAQLVGLKKIPCLMLVDTSAAEEVALIENLQRKDLHPLELGAAYAQLLQNGVCKSQVEIAKKLGVSRTHVVETIGYLNFPGEVRDFLAETNTLTREDYRLISKRIKAGITNFSDVIEGIQEAPLTPSLNTAQKNLAPKKIARKKLVLGVYEGSKGVTVRKNISTLKNITSLKNIQSELSHLLTLVDSQITVLESTKK